MASKSKRDDKQGEAWTPPRGVRFYTDLGRPSPFYVQWRDEGGKRSTKAFDSEDKRVSFAKSLVSRIEDFGRDMLEFDPAEWRVWQSFKAVVGPDVDPLVVAGEWKQMKEAHALSGSSITVSKAIVKYTELRETENSWGADTKRHAETHLERFAEKLGSVRLNDVTSDHVRSWFSDLEARGIGPHGIRDHRKNVSALFTYAIREKWGVRSNPCEFAKAPRAIDGDPVVIPVKAAFDFFKANRDEPVIGRVALEAFGGVRFKTAGLITKDAINLDRKGIRMAAGIHKTGLKDGRNRYRQGQPDNLYQWLAHAPEGCWTMTLLNYREQKRYAGIRANVRPTNTSTPEAKAAVTNLRNVWRHSFISYHLARFKTLPLTQYLAQHASQGQTEDYEGMADGLDAARYFMISPETVLLSWEEFLALPVPTSS